jgi:hypothetical protein
MPTGMVRIIARNLKPKCQLLNKGHFTPNMVKLDLAPASTVGTLLGRVCRKAMGASGFDQALGLDPALDECLGRALGPEGTRPKGGGRPAETIALMRTNHPHTNVFTNMI